MLGRARALVLPVLLVALAAVAYHTRIHREMADFSVYRTAATRVFTAAPLYRADDGHYQFKYLPAFALAVTPLALVDAEAAKTIWFAVSVGLLTIYVRWAVRGLPEPRHRMQFLAWLTVLFMAKFFAHELLLGQTNLLLGTLLVGALLAAQVDLPRVAGMLVGAAVLVKPYALILLPWLVVVHGGAAAGMALGVVGAGLVFPAAVYGWSGNLGLLGSWYRTVTASTEPNLLSADNISFAAAWAKWIGPGRVAAAAAAASGAASLLLVAAVWTRRRIVASPDYLEFALLMLFIPLLSPQGWDYVLLLATPAVVCVVDRWREVTPAWRTAAAVSLGLMGLTLFDVMGRELYGRFMALSIVTVAASGLAVSLVHLRWRAIA